MVCDQSSLNLLISNSMQVVQEYKVLPQFMQQAQQQILVQPRQVNFIRATTTQRLINQFVSHHTQGMIKALFSKLLPADTRLTLVNTTYFKADWQYLFAQPICSRSMW